MGEPVKAGCTRPSAEVAAPPTPKQSDQPQPVFKEERKMIQVGKPAPDFAAPAYFKGGFTTEKLSDHLGKWVVLCFYPGDFTFV